MSLKAPSIVIFDMDGTTVRHLNPRLLYVMEFLDDAAYTIGKAFRWIFRRNAKTTLADFDLDGAPEAVKKRRNPQAAVHRALHKVRRKSVEQIVEPCPGISAALSLLEKHKIPIALVSNGLGKGYGHDILEKFELKKFFHTTIFREDTHHSKPNPEPLLAALRDMQLNISKKDVIWYVGDRRKDVVAAIAASEHLPCEVIPIAYGVSASVEVLKTGLGPEHIMMCYHDMGEILAEMLGPVQAPSNDSRLTKKTNVKSSGKEAHKR